MKRTCKHIDIADHDFVVRSIGNYLCHKSREKTKSRKDIRELLNRFENIDGMADWFSENINNAYEQNDIAKLNLVPVKIVQRFDQSSRKMRNIVIENAINQIYNQIVFDGLQEAARCVGEYQCTCLKNQKKKIYYKDGRVRTEIIGRGQNWAVNAMRGWWSNPEMRACVVADIRKNYETIPQDKLGAYLSKHVCNDKLLWLNRTTWPPDIGLYIGSVSSIINDAIYLSQIYHHMSEDVIAPGRRGKQHRLVEHVEMWMDNIYLLCRSKKDARAAAKELVRFAGTLGMDIKPDWYIVTKKDPPKSPKIHQARQSYIDIVGYRVYPDHITLRNCDYVKVRQAMKKRSIDLHDAQRIVSYNGMIKMSDCYRFRKKYHVKQQVRKAKRIISHESNIQQQAERSKGHNNRRTNNCSDLPERGKEKH